MWDEDLPAALRAELAAQTPPPVPDGLAAVLHQGRRRRRGRQLGTALAVATLLVGTTAAAAALSGGVGALPPAGPPASTSAPDSTPGSVAAPPPGPGEVEWPRADLPAHRPTSVFLPGPAGSPPVNDLPTISLCEPPSAAADRRVAVALAPGQVRARLRSALKDVVPDKSVGELVEYPVWPVAGAESGPTTWFYSADVTVSGSTGSLRLSVGAFDGDPLAAADAQAFDERNCLPPKRLVRPDGTVFQLYTYEAGPPDVSLTQTLRIYRPDGTLYELVAASWGSPDFAPNPDRPHTPNRLSPGRPTLPLTETELARIGQAVAG